MVRTRKKDIVKILKLKHTSIRARGRSSSMARSNNNAVRCTSYHALSLTCILAMMICFGKNIPSTSYSLVAS